MKPAAPTDRPPGCHRAYTAVSRLDPFRAPRRVATHNRGVFSPPYRRRSDTDALSNT